jgi:hypothetical protein
MNLKEEFAEKIISFYTRNGFGRVLKAEIDIAFFHYFLLVELNKKYIESNRIKYFHINKSEIYRLSVRIGLTESRFKRLLEEDFFINNDDKYLQNYILDMVNGRTIKKEGLVKGRIQFNVANPIAKKNLEERFYSCGGILEFGQNNEIAIVEIYDLLKVLQFTEEKDVSQIIRENILAKSRFEEKSPEIKEFFRELEKVPIEERLKKIALGLAEKVIGKAGDEIIGAVFDLIKDKDKK